MDDRLGQPTTMIASLSGGRGPWILVAAAGLAATAASGAFAASSVRIGDALSITNTVIADDGPNAGPMEHGSQIFHEQSIQTGAESAAEFQLLDETHLALGASSQLVLDSLIYDPTDKSANELVLSAAVGSFRFVSGLIDDERVTINTPTSTIGIRGTAFDMHVTREGETVIAVLEGEVEVCNRNRECRRLSTIGRFIKVALGGLISAPVEWNGDLLENVGFETAFPFISDQQTLRAGLQVPEQALGAFAGLLGAAPAGGKVVRQAGETIANTGQKAGTAAGEALTNTGKAVQRAVRKPKIRVPKPRRGFRLKR